MMSKLFFVLLFFIVYAVSGKSVITNKNNKNVEFQTELPDLRSWMACSWMKVDYFDPKDGNSFAIFSYVHNDVDIFKLSLEKSPGRTGEVLKFVINGQTIMKIKAKLDGQWNHGCFSWRLGDMWKFYINGKEYESGIIPEGSEYTLPSGGKIVIGNHETGKQLTEKNKKKASGLKKNPENFKIEIYNFNIYKINSAKEMLIFSDPEYRLNAFGKTDESSEESLGSEESQEISDLGEIVGNIEYPNDEPEERTFEKKNTDKEKKHQDSSGSSEENKKEENGDKTKPKSSESGESSEEKPKKKSRRRRSEKSEMMQSDQPRPVVEETLTKKTANKDEFALSDILNAGNINKIKDFGSKFDPSFNSKVDSVFGGSGGAGGMGNLGGGGGGGLGSFSSLLGGGGGNAGGSPNLGSFSSLLGGGGGGGSPNLGSFSSLLGGGGGGGGANGFDFNSLSKLFKGDPKPPSPSYPSNPSSYPSNPTNYNTNPYPYNPNYPPTNTNTGNLYPTLPNNNPSPNSGNLYPSLPNNNPQPAAPSQPSYNPSGNNNNRGSVNLGDILGFRAGDKAQPNKDKSYSGISFGEIFGFGGSSKKSDYNPNYPSNNNKPASSGGVSLKDIFGFGSKKDESKNSYPPSFGTIGGGIEKTKPQGPKSSFDEISEGLGLSIDPDPIVRNNKPVVVLSQPNQKSQASLSESSYKPREASQLNSQRGSSSYSNRKPVSETSYSSHTVSKQNSARPIEEPVIHASRAGRTRREETHQFKEVAK